MPSFVGDEWLFNAGWSFAAAPDHDLADPARLASAEPWDRLLYVFAQAKKGAFDHVGVLSELLASEQAHPLFLAAMYLGATVGDHAAASALGKWLASDWFTQAAAAVELTGELSFIDPLLQRRRGAGAEIKETMESTISRLLELEPDRFYETELDDDAYEARVRAEVAALVARNGADHRYALGAPLRPRTLVAKLNDLARLDRDPLQEACATIGNVALQLETLTGLPSIGVVALDDGGNDFVDRSRLGRFIEAAESWDAKVRPRSGRRMFFGHVVPDGR